MQAILIGVCVGHGIGLGLCHCKHTMTVYLFAATGGMLDVQEAEGRSDVAASVPRAEGCGCGRARRSHHR